MADYKYAAGTTVGSGFLTLSRAANVNSGLLMSKQGLAEPRWPAFVAMLAAGCAYLTLPEPLSLGPSWLLLATTLVLIIPILVTHRWGRYDIARFLTLTVNGAITVAMIASLSFLIHGLPNHRNPPGTLLRAACALWGTNILVFALWYWELDGGGPLARERAHGKVRSAFLFPQMMPQSEEKFWSPQFVDYLFLAFNTSTAFSPTDTAVLSRRAKLGMMLQAVISLTVIALLAARAVNVL